MSKERENKGTWIQKQQLKILINRLKKKKRKLKIKDKRSEEQRNKDKELAIKMLVDNTGGFAINDILELTENGKNLGIEDLRKKTYEEVSEIMEICVEELRRRL